MSSSERVQNLAHNLDVERTQDVKIDEDITFDGLLLSDKTLEGLKKCGFVKPSPIQLKAIPLGKCGFDLIVEAKSGTGKTAVFSVVALESIQLDVGCQCIIMAPTREIAVQIGQVIMNIGTAFEGLRVEVAMGGTNFNEDLIRLQDAKYQILIGTPGRLKHLIKEKVVTMDTVRLFVLDEADRLMEDSFQKDINFIFSALPERKQVIVVSATYTPELQTFLSNYMRSASHVNPYNSRILLGVSQYISVVKSHLNKVRQRQIILEEVKRILSNIQFKQCLIFCNYQATTRITWKHLCDNGWPAEYLSSSQSQEDRLKSLSKLQSFQCRVLVATDLASRGLDAANVDLVINLETPYDLATYLHRIGRCGRYGAKGRSVTILPEQEEKKFESLLRSYGESFDIKPIKYLINEKSDSKPNDIVKTEMHCEELSTNMDFTSLFRASQEGVDRVLNCFQQDIIDNLLDLQNDFGLEDYYSAFMPKSEVDDVPEFDQINYLKKTIPDYDKMTEYIEKMYISDDEYDIVNQNGFSIEPVQQVSHETPEVKRNFKNPNKKIQKIETSNANVVQINLPTLAIDHVDSTSDVNSSFSDVEEVVGCGVDNGEVLDRSEEYWKWREELSMMSSFIQQTVYLQTLAQLQNMDVIDSE